MPHLVRLPWPSTNHGLDCKVKPGRGVLLLVGTYGTCTAVQVGTVRRGTLLIVDKARQDEPSARKGAVHQRLPLRDEERRSFVVCPGLLAMRPCVLSVVLCLD